MEAYERTQLCDGIKEIKLKKGEIVISEVIKSYQNIKI